MDIDKILASELINKSELSRLLWPEIKYAKSKLKQKIDGTNNRRLTEKDRQDIERIIMELIS